MTTRDCWSTNEDNDEKALIADIEVPGSAADALRALADRLDADEELCLIGLWVMPDVAEYIAGTRLQISATSLRPSLTEEP